MLLFPLLASFIVALIPSAIAHSTHRNPLRSLSIVQDPTISTPSHRVTALQSFTLTLSAFRRHYRLKLEPNLDVLPQGATISYLGPDGEVERTEPIDRLAHKVYAGETWGQNVDGSYSRVGEARLSVYRDGKEPLFEGVLGVNNEHYHIQLAKSYARTKHEEDPETQDAGEDYMVVWRDSDLHNQDTFNIKTELKRSEKEASCNHDHLDFNTDPDHPVYTGIQEQGDGIWGYTPIHSLFSKRQIDTPTGGNSGGVNLASTIGNTNGCPTMRRIALVGVVTDCSYTATFSDEAATRQNVINQMNSASAIWERTFNISLGLANLVISSKDCPGSAPQSARWNLPCSESTDLQDRLNLFSQWRGGRNDNYSHWTLLTNCNTGTAVGLAWLGQACVQTSDTRNATNSAGQTGASQSVSGANVVAKTSTEWQVIAHETGHTFGAVHDCTSSTCSDGTSTKQMCCPLSSGSCDAGSRYLMNPSTGQGITQFSPCSVGNICSALRRNSVRTTCLSSNRDVPLVTGQQCGNGIVETGEDCDCGGTESCGTNQCCDAKTCKFKNGAVCDDSNEECCRSCQLAPSSTVCRASTGVCDPEERCSGSSPSCPTDTTAPDGQDCGSGLKCAAGHCTSRDQQCKTLMGSYTQGNDTYACDAYSCTLSCASPEFGRGVCYGLQQNFLDGTTCGGGGKCQNGACKGSNFGKEIQSWIDDHRDIVIGVASAVGGILLLMVLRCIYRSYMRRRYNSKAAALASESSLPDALWPAQRDYSSSAGLTAARADPYYVPVPPPSMLQAHPHEHWAPPAYSVGSTGSYGGQGVRYA